MDLFFIYWYIRLVFCVLVVRGPFREFFQSQGSWNQLTLQWTQLAEQLLVQCTNHICILFATFPLLPVTVVFFYFYKNLPRMLWPCIMWKLSLKSFIGQTDRNMRPKIKPSRKNIRFLIWLMSPNMDFHLYMCNDDGYRISWCLLSVKYIATRSETIGKAG